MTAQVAVPTSLKKTSDQLISGELYSRAMLAKFFEIQAQGSINTGVFRPDQSRFKSIWLFVTEEKSTDMMQFQDKLTGNVLRWQGQSEQRTDSLIINHRAADLEILVFYRHHKREHESAAFVYEGTFNYQSHEQGSKPTNFVLTRTEEARFTLEASCLAKNLPSGEVDTATLSYIIKESNEAKPLYGLMAILCILRSQGAQALHYLSMPLFASKLLTNFSSALFSTIPDSAAEMIVSEGFNDLITDGAVKDVETIQRVIEHASRQRNLPNISQLLISVLAKFLEAYGTLPTASADEILSDAKSLFFEGGVPYLIQESAFFIQIHPHWINYFERHQTVLMELLVARISLLMKCDLADWESDVKMLFPVDCTLIIAALNSSSRESDQSIASIAQHSHSTSAEPQMDAPSEELSVELPDQSIAIDNCAHSDLESFSIERTQFLATVSGWLPIHQIYFFCLLESLDTHDVYAPTANLKTLTEKIYYEIWMLVRRKIKIGSNDFVEDLDDLKEKPLENFRLYNRGFVEEVLKAIRENILDLHLAKVKKLGLDFNNSLTDASTRDDDSLKQLNFIMSDTEIRLGDRFVATYIAKNVVSLKLWTATQITLTLAALNPTINALEKTIFATRSDILEQVQQELILVSRIDRGAQELTPSRKQSSEQKIIQLESEVGLTRFESLLTNTTTSYKYLLLFALINVCSKTESNQLDISFASLSIEMLTIAAKLLCLNPNLNFGNQDKILDELYKLNCRQQKYPGHWTASKENQFRNSANLNEHELNPELLRYPPFLLLRPLLEDLIPKGMEGDKLTEKIAELSTIYFKQRALLYGIDRKNKLLRMHQGWAEFMQQHERLLNEKVNEKFEPYLLKRNVHLVTVNFGSVFTGEVETGLHSLESAVVESQVEAESDSVTILEDNDIFIAPEDLQNKPLLVCDPRALELSYACAAFPVEDENKSELFKNINAEDSANTIYTAFNRIQNKLHHFPAPRSLCELQVSADDYLWLKNLLRLLSLRTVTSFLKERHFSFIPGSVQHTHQDALGTIFLIACSEVNRREGREGSIWPLFLELFDRSLEPIILSRRYEGAASSEVRDALKAAIKSLDLRNVLAADDHSKYLVTSFLQFGFTRYGIRHLPAWLSAEQKWTESVRYLLTEGSSATSASFQKFWEHCRSFLHKKTSLNNLRYTLSESPWILPEWHDDIISVLENPAEGRYLATPGAGRKSDFDTRPIFSSKLIFAKSDKPHFELNCEFEKLGLKPGQIYSIKIEDNHYRIFETDRGSWQFSKPIEIPFECSEFTVEVVLEPRTPIFSASVSNWQQEDVQFFDLESGSLLSDSFSLKSGCRYGLLVSDDLSVESAPPVRLNFPKIGRVFYKLPYDWSPDLKVLIDEDILWQAATPNADTSIVQSRPAIFAVLESNSLLPGEPAKIVFKGENENTNVEAIRVQGISRQIIWKNHRTETFEAIDLGTNVLANTINVTIKLRHYGQRIVKRQKLRIAVDGVGMWDGIKLTSLSSDCVLTVSECRNKKFLFRDRTVGKADPGEYAVFEGNTLRDKIVRDLMPLPTVAGTGGKLEVRKIFNAGVDATRIKLAQGITDPGMILSVNEVSASEIRLELRESIELSDLHQIIVWPDDAAPIFLRPSDLKQRSERTWDFVPYTASTNIAVALAYDGIYRGASWAPNTRNFLQNVQSKMNLVEIAALLAWIRWPLLLNDNLSAARLFAKNHPVEVLSAWINENGLIEDLEIDELELSSRWSDVIRQVFAFWSPDNTNILPLTNMLSDLRRPTLEDATVITAARRLRLTSPELMARYLSSAFNFAALEKTHLNREQIYEKIEHEILQVNKSSMVTHKALLDECADELNVDQVFLRTQADLVVSSLLENTLDEMQRNNLFVFQSTDLGKRVLSKAIIDKMKIKTLANYPI